MTTLRVATFNIHHGEGLDGRLDLARTASVIRGTGAGIVALQELDRHVSRSGDIDQPEALGDATGLHVRFFPTLELGTGDFGIGLAADVELQANFHPLPRIANERPHGAISARVHDWSVLVTHLSGRPGPRRVQLAALVGLARNLPGPVVVLGDLNLTRWGLEPLRAAGFEPAPGRRRTVHSWWRFEIDHVLAGRGGRVERAWTLESDASDHLPVVADLALL